MAQIILFETPHLQNLRQTGSLEYAAVRSGPGAFTDTVALHVSAIHPDGLKDISFDFLTGPRRMAFPGVEGFRGNPLLMLVLEHDVLEMKQTIGLSAAYFRNRIRESFVRDATVSDGSVAAGGGEAHAQIVTIQPFLHEDRLDRLPAIQAKRYTFVISDAVPGSVEEVRIETPADAAVPGSAVLERFSYKGWEQ